MPSFRRIRTFIWLANLFLRRHGKRILLGLFIGVGLTAVVLPNILSRLTIRPRETFGIVGRYQADDPPAVILQLISQGLTTVSPDGSALPGLATSWDVSADLKTYTFHLPPNLTWSDGSAVEAKQLHNTFKDASMAATTKLNLEIKLNQAYVPLPIVVSRPLFKRNYIGIGAYRVTSLQTNGNYLTEIGLSAIPGTNKPDIVYHFYPTEAAALTAWKMGEVKTVEEMSFPPTGSWKDLVISQVKKDRYVGLFFNTDNPIVSDKSFRQALAYGLEHKVTAGADRAVGPIAPTSWAFNPLVKRYDFDLIKAKQLLAKSSSGSAGLKLTLTTVPNLLPQAEQVADDWKKLGIQTDVKITASLPDTYQVLLITQAVPPDPDQYTLWHSTQEGTNITHLKNPKIDKLLEDGRKTENLKDRKAIYGDFQKTLVEESPVIFLYHPVYYTLTRP
jgi:peptide/nickel transport system substrate-binding protein